MHLFIRGESNPRYDQTVLIIAEKHDIDTACVHTALDLFKKIRKDSNLQDGMKCLHHSIPIFKEPLNMQHGFMTSFKIRFVQMSFSPELHTYEPEGLKQREKGQCHDFFHEMITIIKTIKSIHGLGEKQNQKEM